MSAGGNPVLFVDLISSISNTPPSSTVGLKPSERCWKPWKRKSRPNGLLCCGGPSGSGKSSLVRAGVLPLLTQPGTIEGIGLWRRAVTRPGAGGVDGDCFDALAAALLEPAALPVLGIENR